MTKGGTPVQRTADQDLECWKHFAAMGGTDKNTMITIVSWLLAFAGAAIGFIVTDKEMIGPTVAELLHPRKMMGLSFLGLAVSGLAAYVTLLYGGYTNTNWAKADEIADRHGWRDLLPEGSDGRKVPTKGETSSRVNAVAWRLARPCLPEKELAPVFVVYGSLAVLAALVHLSFVAWSLHSWK